MRVNLGQNFCENFWGGSLRWTSPIMTFSPFVFTETKTKTAPRRTLTRHLRSESGLATRVAHHSIGLDALGADVQMPGGAINDGANPLNVRVETTLVTPV